MVRGTSQEYVCVWGGVTIKNMGDVHPEHKRIGVLQQVCMWGLLSEAWDWVYIQNKGVG